jgi:galactokinase/galacturonokinase
MTYSCVLFSPYRICPIGAHVDHQGGAALGRTIHLGTTLEFEPLSSDEIHLASDQFGKTKFSIGELDSQHWSRYAQAAARVLKIKRGMQAHLTGSLVGAGLSSSASVGLAYLKALAEVNHIELSHEQLVHLDFELEHGQLGLQNGLLDPLSIIYGRKDSLLFMDTATGSVFPIPDPPANGSAWVVAYSGVSRELTNSGFNVRVAECIQAARSMQPDAQKLGDVPRAVFEAKGNSLPKNLRLRARHFYAEVERVHAGAQAWRDGNLAVFGRLMDQSCQSSIHNYQSGSEVLVELHEIASGTDGIYGSRFCGGGYGGCVVALTEKDKAEAACAEIQAKFKSKYPKLNSHVFVVETADGLAASPLAPIPQGGRGSFPSPCGRGVGGGRKPSSAVLLAAGRGKRQRPYTDTTPKPLLEVNRRATLDYVLTAVKKAGIERVCIVTNHLEGKIFEYVGDGSRWNLAVTFAHQTELNGSGSALLSVPPGWAGIGPVIVAATDYVLAENSLLELVQAQEESRAQIVMSLKECPIEELAARSSVDVDSAWRVKRLIEKPKRGEILGRYAASILFVLPPEIWGYLKQIAPSERGEFELQSAVDRMIQDGFEAVGVLQAAPAEWTPAHNAR